MRICLNDYNALLACGNGSSSQFPGTRESTSMDFTTDAKEEPKLVPTVVYSALVNTRYVIPGIINVIDPLLSLLLSTFINVLALQTYLLIHHPLHVKCLQRDNETSNAEYERKVLQ